MDFVVGDNLKGRIYESCIKHGSNHKTLCDILYCTGKLVKKTVTTKDHYRKKTFLKSFSSSCCTKYNSQFEQDVGDSFGSFSEGQMKEGDFSFFFFTPHAETSDLRNYN